MTAKIVKAMKKLGFTKLDRTGRNPHYLFEKHGVKITVPCSPSNIDNTLKAAQREWRHRKAGRPVSGQIADAS